MEIDDLTTSEPGTNQNGTHRQTMRRPKQARKTDRYPRLKTFSHAISLALTGRDSEARQPRSKGGPDEQRQHDEAKDTALAPGRRATEHPNMDHPKAAKTRLLAGRKRAKRLKHEARCPVEPASPTQRTEEPESHPRKGGHWIGNPRTQGTTREA